MSENSRDIENPRTNSRTGFLMAIYLAAVISGVIGIQSGILDNRTDAAANHLHRFDVSSYFPA